MWTENVKYEYMVNINFVFIKKTYRKKIILIQGLIPSPVKLMGVSLNFNNL